MICQKVQKRVYENYTQFCQKLPHCVYEKYTMICQKVQKPYLLGTRLSTTLSLGNQIQDVENDCF
jgi:hypothetical protein